jgi:hypothetical protein
MNWKQSDTLTALQSGSPVEPIGRIEDLRPDVVLPALDHRWCLEFWGDNKTTSRFKTWGHANGDKLGAHFICARGGTAMHTDPGFARYSVHLQLYNGGWVCHGLDGIEDVMPCEPGVVSVLDTWSPHRVSRDPRVPKRSPSKVAAAIDFIDYPEDVPAALDALIAHLPKLEAQ